MKTTILIIALITFQITYSFAGNGKSAYADIKKDIVISGDKSMRGSSSGIPVDRSVPELRISDLAPETPLEADFSDETDSLSFNLRTVEPSTPKEADFE